MFTTLTVAVLATSTLMFDNGRSVRPARLDGGVGLGFRIDYPHLNHKQAGYFLPAEAEGTVRADREQRLLSWDEPIHVTYPGGAFAQRSDTFPIWYEGDWFDAELRTTLRNVGGFTINPYSTQLIPAAPGRWDAYPQNDIYPTITGGDVFVVDWELVGPVSTLSGTHTFPYGEWRPVAFLTPWTFDVPRFAGDLVDWNIRTSFLSGSNFAPPPILYEGKLDGTDVRLTASPATSYHFSLVPEPGGTVLLGLGLLAVPLVRRKFPTSVAHLSTFSSTPN
jgi:hypothetical protein